MPSGELWVLIAPLVSMNKGYKSTVEKFGLRVGILFVIHWFIASAALLLAVESVRGMSVATTTLVFGRLVLNQFSRLISLLVKYCSGLFGNCPMSFAPLNNVITSSCTGAPPGVPLVIQYPPTLESPTGGCTLAVRLLKRLPVV